MTRRDDLSSPRVSLSLVPASSPATDPRVRPERIAQARERIRRGYYDRPDVRRALVEAMIAEFAAPGEAR